MCLFALDWASLEQFCLRSITVHTERWTISVASFTLLKTKHCPWALRKINISQALCKPWWYLFLPTRLTYKMPSLQLHFSSSIRTVFEDHFQKSHFSFFIFKKFNCLFTIFIWISAVCLHLHSQCQLFVYLSNIIVSYLFTFLISLSAVCLLFWYNYQLFVYFSDIIVSCLFTFMTSLSAVCLHLWQNLKFHSKNLH